MFCLRKRSTVRVVSCKLLPAIKRWLIIFAPSWLAFAINFSPPGNFCTKRINAPAPVGNFTPGWFKYSSKCFATAGELLSAGSTSTKRNNSTFSFSSLVLSLRSCSYNFSCRPPRPYLRNAVSNSPPSCWVSASTSCTTFSCVPSRGGKTIFGLGWASCMAGLRSNFKQIYFVYKIVYKNHGASSGLHRHCRRG